MQDDTLPASPPAASGSACAFIGQTQVEPRGVNKGERLGRAEKSLSTVTHRLLRPILVSLPLFLTAPEGVARGSDALTLLEYPETRNQFIDELMEVLPSGRCGFISDASC